MSKLRLFMQMLITNAAFAYFHFKEYSYREEEEDGTV